ncbi:MAG: hypothetical protein RSC91_11540 [Clostridia bacterium]
MQSKLIQATITLQADQVVQLLAAHVTDRHAAMVEQHGEACTKTQASKLISCSVSTINAMLRDGRIAPACGGERVDVRSLADYIENRGEMNRAARMGRKGIKRYV